MYYFRFDVHVGSCRDRSGDHSDPAKSCATYLCKPGKSAVGFERATVVVEILLFAGDIVPYAVMVNTRW